jgi:hypothetical protein
MEGNFVTTRHGNWLKEQLYLDYCVTDYVIVQRNKERTFKKNTFRHSERMDKRKFVNDFTIA